MDFIDQLNNYQPWVFLWSFAGIIVSLLFIGRLMEKRYSFLVYSLGFIFGFIAWPLAMIVLSWDWFKTK